MVDTPANGLALHSLYNRTSNPSSTARLPAPAIAPLPLRATRYPMVHAFPSQCSVWVDQPSIVLIFVTLLLLPQRLGKSVVMSAGGHLQGSVWGGSIWDP